MPEAPRSAGSAAVPLVGGARLPLAFIACGLFAFALGISWMAAEPALLVQPHLHPRLIALVHLWLPGFLLSVTLGAFYQLMPVVLGAPLCAGNGGLWAHFFAHALGVPTLVGGFATGRFECVALGGAFIAAGILFQFTVVARTFAAARRRDAAAWSFPLAAAWLALTVLLGITLALNRRWPFLPLSAFNLLRAHAHLGLVGFFLTLLQGATFQLVPMFTMGEARRPRFIWAGLLGTQGGLLMLVPGLAWGVRPLAVLGAATIAFAIGASGVAFVATLRGRRRKILEPGLRAFAWGAALLAFAAAIGFGLVVSPEHPGWVLPLISVYGVIAIWGALSLMILGMLCKIVPFLVWMRAYGPKVGKQPVPSATALASTRLETGWLAGHLAALVLLVVGCATASEAFARTGAWVLAVAGTLFLLNITRVLAHLRSAKRPALPAAPVSSSTVS